MDDMYHKIMVIDDINYRKRSEQGQKEHDRVLNDILYVARSGDKKIKNLKTKVLIQDFIIIGVVVVGVLSYIL